MISRSGDGDISPNRTSLTFAPASWNTPKTVRVSAAEDDDAVNDSATLAHTASSSDTSYNGSAVPKVAVSVTDDDTAGVTITPTGLSLAEGSSGTYSVVLTSEPAADVVVTITHGGDEDISPEVTSLTFGPASWNTPKMVRVSAAEDDDAVNDSAILAHSTTSSDTTYEGLTVSGVSVSVTDDDMVGVTVSKVRLSLAEGGRSSYTVVLDSKPSSEVTIGVTSSNSDVTLNKTSLMFAPSTWNQTQAVTVSAAQDQNARDDRAILAHTASSSDASYNGVAVPKVVVSVTDDDTAGVRVTPTSLTIPEGGSRAYTVALTSKPSAEVTIGVTSSNSDVTLNKTSLMFAPSTWNQTQTVTVSAAQDEDARDDSASLAHTASSSDASYDGASISDVTVSVTDDDTAGVTITPTSLNLTEGSSGTYSVVLTSEPAADVVVTITHGGDEDVAPGSSSLTFTDSNWNTSQSVTVQASQDPDAVDDSAMLTHTTTSSDADYDGLTLSSVQISVGDDDTAGVSITPTSLTIPEGASRTYTVVLTSRPSAIVGLAVNSNNSDLTPSPASLTFSLDNWNNPQTITVAAAQDDDATDEMATLAYAVTSSDPAYHGISVPSLSVEITDDDTVGVMVKPGNLTIREGNSRTYTLMLNSKPLADVTFTIASNNSDVTLSLASLRFTAADWNQAQTVTVGVREDDNALDETAWLSHTAASADPDYDGIPVDKVGITVTDDDSAGVSVTPTSLTIPEGATGIYAVVLTSRPSNQVQVAVASNNSKVTPSPTSLTFDSRNWNTPQTITAAGNQDDDAVNDDAILSHSATSVDSTYDGIPVDEVRITVSDDDSVGVAVTPVDLTIDEGGSETYTVVLASKPSADVALLVSSNNRDVTPSPTSLTFRPLTWSTAQTVTVTIAQDHDATEEMATLTYSVTSSDPAYDGISVPGVSIDVTEDDNAGVHLVPNPHLSLDEGASATYTVVLISQPLAEVAIAIISSSSLISTSSESITFTPDDWQTPQTVIVTAENDDDRDDENETIHHTAASLDPTYNGISIKPQLVTVIDMTTEQFTKSLPLMLSALSGALAESAQTAIESRFERQRQLLRMDGKEGWWMPTYYQDQSSPSLNFDRSMGPGHEPILSQASFGLPLYGEAFGGTNWRPVLWGHGDFQHFNGNLTALDYRGALAAAHVGMDLYSNRQMLTGLSFARSWGAMDYTDERNGALKASLNTLHPYLYWQPHNRIAMWGIGGFGRGSIDVTDPRLSHNFKADFRMWAGGARSLLTTRGKNELGLRFDGFTASLGINPFEGITDVYGRAARARAMLEAVHHRSGSKRSLSLKGELGGRLDRGDAMNGTGLEAGLRFGFIDTPTGLDLSLQGRMLLVHGRDFRDWGAGFQASWDPGNKGRGLRVSGASARGQDGRGGTTLWNNPNAVAQGRDLLGISLPQNRIEGEAAYGRDVLRGRGLLTSYSRLRLTRYGRELSVGSEFGLQSQPPPANPLKLELEGIRRKNRRGVNMGVRVRMSIPF